MPNIDIEDIKKQTLEKRLANLSEEYIEINKQIDREGDSDKRIQLQRKINNLEEYMEEIDAKLKELENLQEI